MEEMEAIERAHRSAQAKLGLAVAALTDAEWQSVALTSSGATGGAWANTVAEAVSEAQALSYELARAYYQVARATEVGVLLGDPLDGLEATLGNARDSFIQRLLDVDELGSGSSEHSLGRRVPTDKNFGLMELSDDLRDFLDLIDESRDDEVLEIDEFEWRDPAGDGRQDAVARDLFDKAVNPFMDQQRRIRQSSREDEGKGAADRALRKIEDAWDSQGKLGSSRADELVSQYGRNVLDRAHRADRRVLKYARGTGANPCHFCAMLAARGFVYASRSTAMSTYRTGGMRSYHPNCHCYPIARWSDDSSVPERNLAFARLWDSEISGNYSGKEAIQAWRQLLNSRRDAAGRLNIDSSPRRTA